MGHGDAAFPSDGWRIAEHTRCLHNEACARPSDRHRLLPGSASSAFDRKPPLDPINYAALNYNPTYGYSGIVGRFFNLGVKVRM